MQRLRLFFFGSDEIALPCLEQITGGDASAFRITGVVSQPDRPSGRGGKTTPNAIVLWARAHDIPVFQPENPGPETTALLRETGCDAALVMAYGRILKRDLLDAPPLGFFNLHASLLPLLRGATPIEGAIASGFAETGVSLQRVVPKLDAGPVVDFETVLLAPDETRLTLREKVAAACVPLIARALPRIAAGDAAGVPQNEARVTFTRKITREDSGVDFRAAAWEIAARVRALSPWPGVTLPAGNDALKIGEAAAEEAAAAAAGAGAGAAAAATSGTGVSPVVAPGDIAPGTVLSANAHGLRLATGRGVLRVLQLQRPGGRMLPIGAFLAGNPIAPGFVFEHRPMPALTRPAA